MDFIQIYKIPTAEWTLVFRNVNAKNTEAPGSILPAVVVVPISLLKLSEGIYKYYTNFYVTSNKSCGRGRSVI